MQDLIQHALTHSMTYAAYRHMLDELMAKGQTTGSNQSPSMLDYAKLNLQRMSRWDKTATLLPEIETALAAMPTAYTWLVITEGWCGDAAQSVPFMEKIAAASAGKITLRVILRDEHLPLMDLFLTHGGRSIPKLLVLQPETHEVLNTWGPRPAQPQQIVSENALKSDAERMPQAQMIEAVHRWYAQDKGASVQRELMQLLQ